MKSTIYKYATLALIGFFAALGVSSSAQIKQIGIEPQIGSYVSKTLFFTNSEGKVVYFRDLIDRPTILTLVYYECPAICTPLLEGLVESIQLMEVEESGKQELGGDYQIVTVSFNPEETIEQAARKKQVIIDALGLPISRESWQFCVGTLESISALTRAVGFNYTKTKDGEEYQHSASLVILDKEGKITGYMKGLVFQPFALKMALQEASEGREGGVRGIPTKMFGNPIRYICFSVDPETGERTVNITRIFGLATILFAGGFVGFFIFVGKKRSGEA